jgi:hypothetical protein
MRERQTNVLAEQQCVAGLDCRGVQQARKPRHVIVREELRGVLVHEPCGGKNLELFMAIQLEDVADAVQHFAAYAAIA